VFVWQVFGGSKQLNPVRRSQPCPSMHVSQIRLAHPRDAASPAGWDPTHYTDTFHEKETIPVSTGGTHTHYTDTFHEEETIPVSTGETPHTTPTPSTRRKQYL
jgi:hypothetical protein